MARVSVDDRVFSDARFDILGALLGESRHAAVGRMLRVWHECLERTSYTLPARVVAVHLGSPEGPDRLVEAELAEWAGDGVLRIRGTEGRIEWLEHKRETARANGAKGGRPRSEKTKEKPTSVIDGEPTPEPDRIPAETPLVPVIAPVTAKEKIPTAAESALAFLEEKAKAKGNLFTKGQVSALLAGLEELLQAFDPHLVDLAIAETFKAQDPPRIPTRILAALEARATEFSAAYVGRARA